MGSRDGYSSAGSGRSRSSNKHADSPFVDHWGGYTWDDGARQWTYDGCNGIYPPSRHDALPPDRLPFNGRKPFSDSCGHHFTPDENENVYPSDEYGRYRSTSPEGSSAHWSNSLPIRELGSNRRPRTVSPNTETLERKPRYSSWTLEEEERLVSLISEERYTWAEISMQFEHHDEDCVRKRWHKIKSEYPDVHYVNPKLSQPHLDGDIGSRRRRSG